MNGFYEMISEINELSEISEVAWHTIDDEPIKRTYVSVKDVDGKEIEILMNNRYGEPILVNCVLVSVLMTHIMQIVVFPWWSDIQIPVNEARKKYPYTGVTWINEAKSRMYDHIPPEYKF